MSIYPYDPHAVGRRIRLLRHALNFDRQEDFAQAIGAKKGEVGSWESGMRRPSLQKAEPMMAKWGVTLDWLFMGNKRAMPFDLVERIEAAERALGLENQG